MDNLTHYDGVISYGENFVKMAWNEFKSPQQNWTDLVLRYWNVVDERLGGNRVVQYAH